MIYEQSDCFTPTIFLLSKGSNPTDGVLGQARKLKVNEWQKTLRSTSTLLPSKRGGLSVRL